MSPPSKISIELPFHRVVGGDQPICVTWQAVKGARGLKRAKKANQTHSKGRCML